MNSAGHEIKTVSKIVEQALPEGWSYILIIIPVEDGKTLGDIQWSFDCAPNVSDNALQYVSEQY